MKVLCSLLLLVSFACLSSADPTITKDMKKRLDGVPRKTIQTENYEYYCTGNCDVDFIPDSTSQGTVLMGGSTDVDAAFEWMIDRMGGGDFLVLRTTGSDAYDPYIYDMGGVNSASTLIILNRNGSYEPEVSKIIEAADGLFFAGGDQWTYYSYWKNSPVQDSVEKIRTRNIPMGGTSAGNAIQPSFIYTAQFGTVYSDQALDNPYDYRVTIGADFLRTPYLENAITDTHFAQRDRMGRFMTFVARLIADVWSSPLAIGVAVDEKTALLIDENGMASTTTVFDDGAVYMLLPDSPPETCTANENLEWSNVDVYRITGNATNVYSFATSTKFPQLRSTTSYQLSASKGKLTSTQRGGKIY
uniref:Cyanophycinase n=1 Tax=Paramoeba aestuarina TaxID=180227 RepID=A0A6U3AAL2_9EUKA|mmetsp:Transcript_2856/g.4443  ORF Transcript_2856/g.4443 Transcript_2856/m.4443 type:complete len:359 (+) Transcript_2856:118-1194(+)